MAAIRICKPYLGLTRHGANRWHCDLQANFGIAVPPISDWFGTTPEVLEEIIKSAINEKENPKSPRSCKLM